MTRKTKSRFSNEPCFFAAHVKLVSKFLASDVQKKYFRFDSGMSAVAGRWTRLSNFARTHFDWFWTSSAIKRACHDVLVAIHDVLIERTTIGYTIRVVIVALISRHSRRARYPNFWFTTFSSRTMRGHRAHDIRLARDERNNTTLCEIVNRDSRRCRRVR